MTFSEEEVFFVKNIEDKINIIFDVGCRDDSLFSTMNKEVHYFEPRKDFINIIKNKTNNNTKSTFNNFGLSDQEELIEYNIGYESFFDRSFTLKDSTPNTKINLEVKRADKYIKDNNINYIDFLKIDTEGYELKVLKGFGENIKIVKIIQFEYGGTFLDSNTTLKEIIYYLKYYGFDYFRYLRNSSLEPITDYTDHYNYSNIVCYNKSK